MIDFLKPVTDAQLKALTNEQLKQAILIIAMSLKELKAEAVRRGTWESLKGTKVE